MSSTHSSTASSLVRRTLCYLLYFFFGAAVDLLTVLIVLLSTMCCLTGQNHSINGTFVFQLESPVKLHSRKNYVSLLSGTVGLEVLAGRLKIHLSTENKMFTRTFLVVEQNYGAFFELVPAGIVGGPVKLLGANGTGIDLSNSSWTYMVRTG
jgi:hypothetical protein